MKKLGDVFAVFLGFWVTVDASCSKGCDLALASYFVGPGVFLSYIAEYLNTNSSAILSYNPDITNPNNVPMGSRVNVPFSCDCINGDFLGHVFRYRIQSGDTYASIAQMTYSNLTTPTWIQRFNSYDPNSLPVGGNLNLTVNCSCGNSSVSPDYGLFITFPLRSGDSLNIVARRMNVSASLLQRYNPDADFSPRTRLVYIPAQDRNGSYRPLTSGSSKGVVPPSGKAHGVVIGVCVAVAAGLSVFSISWYLVCIRGKKKEEALLFDKPKFELPTVDVPRQSTVSAVAPGITVDKSVEFSYDELASATNNFSMANKIGEGGFGAVYYGELRGEKAAIKKMDMQATKEFLAELKVLTHVHHLNLVRLIGYCVERSLFLAYEYIENGTLSQHLRGLERTPLPWPTRVQIALDSARGLEYIHEHTVPVYIHRDIKSANILIDNDFHAKVADFGLAKLSEVRNASLPTRLAGTFGYMPPEYAQFGDVSAKVDVFALGVVLYELISAKGAVVKEDGPVPQPKSLVSLFEDALIQPDPNSIRKLVDPRLGDDYPLHSVLKMAQLAQACTQDDPDLRPTMRSVVVDLIALSSMTDNSDIASLSERDLLNPVSGR